MRRPSIRGLGIRYAIALTLPVTGIALVLYTVAQLLSYSIQERWGTPRPLASAIQGSLSGGAGRPLPEAEPVASGRPAPKR
jgi:hypothetical protein